MHILGFPGGASGKEHACQCWRHKRCGFDPWVRKIPWKRAWKPTPVLMPEEPQGQRSLVGYSPWGCKESLSTLFYFFPGGSDNKEFACNVGDLGLIPRLGRSPGRGHGNPLQYFFLENPQSTGAWRAPVHGVTRSWT